MLEFDQNFKCRLDPFRGCRAPTRGRAYRESWPPARRRGIRRTLSSARAAATAAVGQVACCPFPAFGDGQDAAPPIRAIEPALYPNIHGWP